MSDELINRIDAIITRQLRGSITSVEALAQIKGIVDAEMERICDAADDRVERPHDSAAVVNRMVGVVR
jgi:hypothetical protein